MVDDEHEMVVRVREKLVATGKTQMEIADGTEELGLRVGQTTVSRIMRGSSPNMRIKTLSMLEKFADSVLEPKEDAPPPAKQKQQSSRA